MLGLVTNIWFSFLTILLYLPTSSWGFLWFGSSFVFMAIMETMLLHPNILASDIIPSHIFFMIEECLPLISTASIPRKYLWGVRSLDKSVLANICSSYQSHMYYLLWSQYHPQIQGVKFFFHYAYANIQSNSSLHEWDHLWITNAKQPKPDSWRLFQTYIDSLTYKPLYTLAEQQNLMVYLFF